MPLERVGWKLGFGRGSSIERLFAGTGRTSLGRPKWSCEVQVHSVGTACLRGSDSGVNQTHKSFSHGENCGIFFSILVGTEPL